MGGDSKVEDALAFYDQGRAAMARGDHAVAVEKLKAAVALAPSASSLALLGQSLLRLSRNAEAVIYLAAAVGLGDRRPAVRTSLASALHALGDQSEAVRLLRDVLGEQPEDAGARAELQRVLAGSVEVARKYNRHRLIKELRTALPGASESLMRTLDLPGIQDLSEALRGLLPDFELAETPARGIGPALGRYYVDAVVAGAPEVELTGRLLSRMADSNDIEVRGAFDDALARIVDAASPKVIDAARRVFSGNAQKALENLA